MTKFASIICALALFSFCLPTAPLSDKERKDATDLLKKTEQGVFDAVKGLSEAQLKYKAAPDRWSIEECVIHIATTEAALWSTVDSILKQPANPDKRSEVKITDDKVVPMLEDRSHKVKTSPMLEPQNSPFKTMDDALKAFKTNSEKLIAYVSTTNDDMRNHVVTYPFGSFDSYQMLLFIGAHNNRHTQQIDEVKADAGYPKK